MKLQDSNAELRAAFRDMEKRVAAMAVREGLEKELWRVFCAWWGWNRLLERTRRNGLRRYQRRHVVLAAAFLGVRKETVYRSLHRERPTTAILQGLVMLPYPRWSGMAQTTAKRHAAERLKMFREAQPVRYGDAGKLAAEWRRQWESKTADGQTARALVQGERYSKKRVA